MCYKKEKDVRNGPNMVDMIHYATLYVKWMSIRLEWEMNFAWSTELDD